MYTVFKLGDTLFYDGQVQLVDGVKYNAHGQSWFKLYGMSPWCEYKHAVHATWRVQSVPRAHINEYGVQPPYREGDWVFSVKHTRFYRVVEALRSYRSTIKVAIGPGSVVEFAFNDGLRPAKLSPITRDTRQGECVVWNGIGAYIGLVHNQIYNIKSLVQYSQTLGVALEGCDGGPLLDAKNFSVLDVVQELDDVRALDYRGSTHTIRTVADVGTRFNNTMYWNGAVFVYGGPNVNNSVGMYMFEGGTDAHQFYHSNMRRMHAQCKDIKDAVGAHVHAGDMVYCINPDGCKHLHHGTIYKVMSTQPIKGTIKTIPITFAEGLSRVGYSPRRFMRIQDPTPAPDPAPTAQAPTVVESVKSSESVMMHGFYVGQIVEVIDDKDLGGVIEGDEAQVVEVGTTRIKVRWNTNSSVLMRYLTPDDTRQADGWYSSLRFGRRGCDAEYGVGD